MKPNPLPERGPAAPKKKRKKPFSATRRALEDLRAMGFVPWVVESKIPHTFITRDCYGFADVLAHRPGIGILLIQVTGGGNHSKRRAKCLAEPRVQSWLESGGRVEIWSYDLRGAKGARKTYLLRREEIRADDLFPVSPPELAGARGTR
jgi:hypothetical protein